MNRTLRAKSQKGKRGYNGRRGLFVANKQISPFLESEEEGRGTRIEGEGTTKKANGLED